MGQCAKCGDCCRAIPLRLTKAQLRTQLVASKRNQEDREFILKHWHRISRVEAARRIPSFGIYDGTPERFYECDQFDPGTNLCMAHDTRPPVCRGFPWYSTGPDETSLRAFPRCSFWHDVPREKWPAGVIPLTPAGGAE